MPESFGQPREPLTLALREHRPHEEAPRKAQYRNEEEHPHERAANPDLLLAEVGLRLLARARLVPHRNQSLGPQPLALLTNGPLDGAHAGGNAARHQHLAHHDRITCRFSRVKLSDLFSLPLAQPPRAIPVSSPPLRAQPSAPPGGRVRS
jgi:hypothetical protein